MSNSDHFLVVRRFSYFSIWYRSVFCKLSTIFFDHFTSINFVRSQFRPCISTRFVSPLFNIYINDITKYISEECRIIQYADDCLIYSANPKPDIAFENLQICLEKLENYFRSNQLTLNASKTEFICFSTPKITVSNSQLIVAGSNIKLKNEVKYLGIIIDNKLTFEYQVKSVLKKWPLA